jgi:hypothetical protein
VNAGYDVWTDPDLDELVRREPELAAIADALSQARPPVAKARRGRPARALALGGLLAAAVALALIAPWDRGGASLSDVALAAVGSQPVLHVVAAHPAGGELVDLSTGSSRPVILREELWYDADRGLKRSLTTVDGAITDDVLETPDGGFTPGGIVYDCTWIAAHPVAATRARVSCNASGDNGTTPHVVPRPKPALEPGLAGFVDGYRDALASGLARDGGSGVLDGRPVDRLVFDTGAGTETVSLDTETHKPLLLEDSTGWSLAIESIETAPYDSALFARPRPDELPPRPSRTASADGPVLPPGAAAIASALTGAVWPGGSVGGLPLRQAEQTELSSSFARGSRPDEHGPGLELDYGSPTANGRLDRSAPYVRIAEAPSATLATMWGFVRGDGPRPGELYAPMPAGADEQVGFLVSNGVYVTIEASSRELLLATARALEPA